MPITYYRFLHSSADAILLVIKIIWHAAALIAISACFAYLLMYVLAGDGPVWTSSNLRVQNSTVPVHGNISYIIDVKAHSSCPGDIVSVMTTIGSDPPAAVTFRRPLVRPGVSIKDFYVSVQLPDSVTPGLWRFTSSIDSRCPTRIQLDDLVEFIVKVTP
jgi:hypothetical protein